MPCLMLGMISSMRNTRLYQCGHRMLSSWQFMYCDFYFVTLWLRNIHYDMMVTIVRLLGYCVRR